MSRFEKLWLWLLRHLHALAHTVWRRRIRTYELAVCNAAPPLSDIRAAVLHVVHTGGKDRWAMLRCPCGCGEIVTLSLQGVHHPHWKLDTTPRGRPSLHPSIWRREGCRSHFWVMEGRVHWC